MPANVKIEPNPTRAQSHIIPDATPKNDGIMTAEQAAKLAGLSPGGASGVRFTVLKSAVNTSVDYGQLMEADPTLGHIDVSMPNASDVQPNGPNTLIVVNNGTANTVGLRLHVGDSIPITALGPGQYAIFVSDGVSEFILVSSNVPTTALLALSAKQTAAFNAQPNTIVWGDSTAGDFPVNLPSAAANGAGMQIWVKNTGSANLVNITPTGGDTVEGAALLALAPGESAMLVSDGVSNWMQF
jgi:hypothetical protein